MKKIFKRFFIIIVVVSMLFLLIGCGKGKNKDKSINEQMVNKQKKEFSMGEWTDNVYTNDFLGLKFKLPEGWIYLNSEQLEKYMNKSYELLNDEQKSQFEKEKLDNNYYIMATDTNTGSNLTIVSEKPSIEISTETFIKQIKNQLLNLGSIKYQIGKTAKEKIAGREYDTLTVLPNIKGSQIIQKYYIYKMDEYFISLIVTSTTGETTINDIIKNFE